MNVRRILPIVMGSAGGPVFVHCRKGSDRTGIIVAAFRIRHQGWTIDRAYEEMKSFGHKSIRLFWWKDVLRDITCDPSRDPVTKLLRKDPVDAGESQTSSVRFAGSPQSWLERANGVIIHRVTASPVSRGPVTWTIGSCYCRSAADIPGLVEAPLSVLS